jgi:hypothetical protein
MSKFFVTLCFKKPVACEQVIRCDVQTKIFNPFRGTLSKDLVGEQGIPSFPLSAALFFFLHRSLRSGKCAMTRCITCTCITCPFSTGTRSALYRIHRKTYTSGSERGYGKPVVERPHATRSLLYSINLVS